MHTHVYIHLQIYTIILLLIAYYDVYVYMPCICRTKVSRCIVCLQLVSQSYGQEEGQVSFRSHSTQSPAPRLCTYTACVCKLHCLALLPLHLILSALVHCLYVYTCDTYTLFNTIKIAYYYPILSSYYSFLLLICLIKYISLCIIIYIYLITNAKHA